MLSAVFVIGFAFTLNLARDAAELELQRESRLQELLHKWEKADQGVRAVHYIMEWTIKDVVLKNDEVNRVEGFINGPKLVRVDFKDEKGKPTSIVVIKDKDLEWYLFQNEQKGICRIPSGFPEDYLDAGWLKGSIAQNYLHLRELLCWEFPIGKIKERFEIRLKKEDENWAYIQLIPKPKDKHADYRQMEVVLDQKTHFVRQYRLLGPNGNWCIYDFQKLEINPTSAITVESICKDLPKTFKETPLSYLLGETDSQAPDSK